jgi:hypothetical protein
MDGWVTFQISRQHSEDLRRESETQRLARTLRKGSLGRSRRFPVPWWELRRYGGRVLESFGGRGAKCRNH